MIRYFPNVTGEKTMKRTVLFIMFIMTVMCAGQACAYEFRVFNSTQSAKSLSCDIYGEHIFWQPVDCTIGGIGPAQSGSCDTGLICPKAIACKITCSNGKVIDIPWTYFGTSCFANTVHLVETLRPNGDKFYYLTRSDAKISDSKRGCE